MSIAPNSNKPVIAITCGEPAGIGPEISLRAAWSLKHEIQPVLIGDAAWLSLIAREIDERIRLLAISPERIPDAGLPRVQDDQLLVLDCPALENIEPGVLNPRNAKSVLQTLDVAVSVIQATWCDAMVTAPIQKSCINDAGISFSGHTEYLAEKTNTPQVVMMLACAANERLPVALRVALASTHMPLSKVSSYLNQDHLLRVIQIIDHDLKQKFGIATPNILVTGLNPHAGEGGHMGREEIDVITPAIQAANAQGLQVSGPFPADTIFQNKYLQQADCILSMFHDQGLPVLKFASFGMGVNITLGLPLIRTSVDHGTALDIAARGLGIAEFTSMQNAIREAAAMVNHTESQ